MAKQVAVPETQASHSGRALWRSLGASPLFQAELSLVQADRAGAGWTFSLQLSWKGGHRSLLEFPYVPEPQSQEVVPGVLSIPSFLLFILENGKAMFSNDY